MGQLKIILSSLAQSEFGCKAPGDCVEREKLWESRKLTLSPANKETRGPPGPGPQQQQRLNGLGLEGHDFVFTQQLAIRRRDRYSLKERVRSPTLREGNSQYELAADYADNADSGFAVLIRVYPRNPRLITYPTGPP